MKYDLVFEGGGAKGMVFVGAMQAFEAREEAERGRLLGSSAGAITATLLAAGYTADEMLAALGEKEGDKSVFASFMGEPAAVGKEAVKVSAIYKMLDKIDIPWVPGFAERWIDALLMGALQTRPWFRNLYAFVEDGGWFSADRFVTWLEQKLAAKNPKFAKMTMAEFYAETQVPLSITASDTTASRLLVMNHVTTPDCPVVWAVRMSMSIPFVWPEVVWLDSWGKLHKKKREDGVERTVKLALKGHQLVDGGMLSNFPIELFVSAEPQITKIMGVKSDEVLGFLIDETQSVADDPREPSASESFFGELQTVQRLGRLVNTLTQAHDKMVMDETEHLVVRLPAKGYGTTDFDMPEDRRAALVKAGKDATEKYFAEQGAKGVFEMMPTEARVDRIANNILGF